ncbi:MAG TPA: glycosyltransferase family 2 protein [Pirellulales bacterium]|jgi:succinoglycan biosynthesis protein ExoA
MSILETNRDRTVQGSLASAARPFISVVMPVRNEASAIGSTLNALLRQSYALDRFEIIVVDGESTDRTREIVQGFIDESGSVRLLANPRRWSSAARNLGIQAARGEILLIVDGHCEIGSDRYLDELAWTFERTSADCLGRPQPLETSQPSTLQRAIGIARASRLGHHPASHVFSKREQVVPAHSVAVAYRRTVFDRVGLFDESFDACEDVELNHRIDRAGMRCVFVPALRVGYHPRATLARLFQQMSRYGRGRMRLLRKHPETFSPLGFVPALFLLFVLVGALLTPWSRSATWLLATGVASYGLVVVGFSAGLAIRNRCWKELPLLPAVFMTLHVGAGMGVLLELIRPTRRSAEDVTRHESS